MTEITSGDWDSTEKRHCMPSRARGSGKAPWRSSRRVFKGTVDVGKHRTGEETPGRENCNLLFFYTSHEVVDLTMHMMPIPQKEHWTCRAASQLKTTTQTWTGHLSPLSLSFSHLQNTDTGCPHSSFIQFISSNTYKQHCQYWGSNSEQATSVGLRCITAQYRHQRSKQATVMCCAKCCNWG